MSTATALQNYLQQATGVNVSDQTISNRLLGGLRACHPLVDPVLTAQHCGGWLGFAIENLAGHWRTVLFTDESRFTLSTRDRFKRVWRSYGERYAACNIIQYDRFGGGSVMVLGGISMEGRTNLYRLDNRTMTATRYQNEIHCQTLCWCSGSWVHQWKTPGSWGPPGEGIDTTDWPPRLPNLNPIEHLWDIMFQSIQPRQVAPQTVQKLSDALVQIWEEIPRIPSIISLGACFGNVSMHSSMWGAIQTTEYHFKVLQWYFIKMDWPAV